MEADAIVGKVLDAFKELDFARDTIVIFTSDCVPREEGDRMAAKVPVRLIYARGVMIVTSWALQVATILAEVRWSGGGQGSGHGSFGLRWVRPGAR
jgi:arylsulfatase A-like enzyme